MHTTCPKCGAALPPGETCRERFEVCLALEFEHPATYGAVHYFSVTSYMLQHNEYARQAWLETRAGLATVIRDGLSPANLRRKIRGKMDSGKRQFRITRGEKIAEVEAIQWGRSIADVRLDDPGVYNADVKQWAVQVLADTDALVQKLAQGS